MGNSVRLPVSRAGLPGRAAQAEGGVSDSWRDREGGGQAACWGACRAGPGEVRALVAGLSRRKLGMAIRGGRGSGVPAQATLYDQISDFFF